MKSGKILHQFTAQDGKKVILRTPKWEDLDDLMEVINSVIEEGSDIEFETKKTREEEVDWLASTLVKLEKDSSLPLVAEVEGKVVASSSLRKSLLSSEKHLGRLGIIIKSGYRDIGIGTEMMKTSIEQAKLMGLKILTLSVFATNKKAFHVYEKVGFKEAGRIIKGIFRNGQYIDRIIMIKQLFED